MNTIRYQSLGAKAFSAGMMDPEAEEFSMKKSREATGAGRADGWWENWDNRWINHYDEEWAAFAHEYSQAAAEGRSETAEAEALPRVWNLPSG